MSDKVEVELSLLQTIQDTIDAYFPTHPVKTFPLWRDKAFLKFQEIKSSLSTILAKEEKKREILKKLDVKLNEDRSYLTERIVDHDAFESIKWQFVPQECRMYCLIGKQVERSDLEWLCERRGFDEEIKQYLIDTMKHIGLGEKL